MEGGGWGSGGVDAALLVAADPLRLPRGRGDRIRHHGELRGSSRHAATAAAALSIDVAPTPAPGRLWPITTVSGGGTSLYRCRALLPLPPPLHRGGHACKEKAQRRRGARVTRIVYASAR